MPSELDVWLACDSRFSPGTSPREAARGLESQAALAYLAGFDGLYVGDHHGLPDELFFQNVPLLARLLDCWPDRRVAALFVLPLWHPLHVAESVGTLAAMTDAELTIVAALGGNAAEFAATGIPMRERRSRLDESIGVITRLLDGGRVDSARWGIQGAGLGLRPAGPTPIWVAAASEPGLARAASVGQGWIAPPNLSLAESVRLAQRYRELCAQRGTFPGAIAIRRDVYVPSDADALRRARGWALPNYGGYSPSARIIGTADEIIRHLDGLAAAGFTDVLLRMLGTSSEKGSTIESLASVLPRG